MPVFNPIQILVVDDEESIRRLAEKELANERRTVRTADSARQADQLIAKQRFDVIVLDILLPDANGLDLLEKFLGTIPDVEVILITGNGSMEGALEAMKMGAYDYVTKPFSLDRLEVLIDKAFERVCLQRENRLLRHTQNHPKVVFKLL